MKPAPRLPFRAVLVADDAVYRVNDRGEIERVVASGQSHPTGWNLEPTATARRASR